MTAVALTKHSRPASGYLYDTRTRSWVALYPNQDFIQPPVDERRPQPAPERGADELSQIEIDVTVGVLALIQILAAIYVVFGLHLA